MTTKEHPHGRGEDAHRFDAAPLGDGTPPRAWGGHGAALLPCRFRRNTPTGVGRTKGRSRERELPAEHPTGVGRTLRDLGLCRRAIRGDNFLSVFLFDLECLDERA